MSYSYLKPSNMKSKKKSVKKSEKLRNKSTMKEISCKKLDKKKGPPERVKKKLMIPTRNRLEPFKTLMISRRQIAVSDEKAYAFEIRKLGSRHNDFVKLDLPGDIMDNSAHKVGMPTRFSSTLYAPTVKGNAPLIHSLYKTYNFVDDLTKYDIFRRASYYYPFIGKRKKATDSFRLGGMAVCIADEVRKRREKFRLRGKWRPEYSNYGRRMLESPRMMVAKLMKYGHPYFGQLITRRSEDAQKMITTLLNNLEQNYTTKEKETKARFSKFWKHNRDWVHDRIKIHQEPMFVKFNRERISRNVVNRHLEMPWRRLGDQDIFNEFNYLSSHLAFSAHFCKVVRSFQVNAVKEDEVIKKTTSLTPLIRVRFSRYNHFPAVSVVNYDDKDQLQITLPRIIKKAPSIAPVSGYSSDSGASAASNTPLDWEIGWDKMSKTCEHRINNIGDVVRSTAHRKAEAEFAQRKWKEMERRKKLVYRADGRFELQNTVPIFKEIPKMHPPLIYCKLKGMELNKLRRTKFREIDDSEAYLIRQRMNHLEKTLPCKDDPRILISPGWKVFAARENADSFPHVARILKQRSSWVSSNCMSRAATVPRCDKLRKCDYENIEGKNKKLFLVLILPLTLALMIVTFGMISFL